jgi:hypothetical protein
MKNLLKPVLFAAGLALVAPTAACSDSPTVAPAAVAPAEIEPMRPVFDGGVYGSGGRTDTTTIKQQSTTTTTTCESGVYGSGGKCMPL